MAFNHRDEHVDDQMLVVQANLDDMNPEWVTYVMDKLFDAGANDVYVIPIIMKRGRPGIMLNVLVEEERFYPRWRRLFLVSLRHSAFVICMLLAIGWLENLSV